MSSTKVETCGHCGRQKWAFLGPPEEAPPWCGMCRPLYEQLAAIEHERWADWQRWVHESGTRNPDGSITIPAERVARWERQINTPYAELNEDEKESDRREVNRYWPLLATEGDR